MAQQVISGAGSGSLGLAALFAQLRTRWQRRKAYHAAYAELNALSTQQLADLGLSRSMISRLAHEAAAKKSPG